MNKKIWHDTWWGKALIGIVCTMIGLLIKREWDAWNKAQENTQKAPLIQYQLEQLQEGQKLNVKKVDEVDNKLTKLTEDFKLFVETYTQRVIAGNQ